MTFPLNEIYGYSRLCDRLRLYGNISLCDRLRSFAIIWKPALKDNERPTTSLPPHANSNSSFSLPPTPSSFTPGFCSISHKPPLSPQRFKMSAFLYTFERELITLNVGDFQFQNGLKFKKVAAKFCRVSLNE